MLPPLFAALVVQTASVTLHGVVTEDATRAALRGARVTVVGAGPGTSTDSSGVYVLVLRRFPGRDAVAIAVSRLGYESRAISVVFGESGRLRVDFALRARAEQIAEVRVAAAQQRDGDPSEPTDETAVPIGAQRLTMKRVRADPMLSAPDALLALTTAAGWTDPELPTAMHVRGGSSHQTRVLLDGIPVYSPVHATGTFAAFDVEALNGITLHVAPRSAAFGRSLSATIIAETRTPDTSRVVTAGGVSTTNWGMTSHGPLGRRSGFLLSAKAGSPSLFGGQPDRRRVSASFSDAMAKVSMRAGRGGTLTFLAAATADQVGVPVTATPEESLPRSGQTLPDEARGARHGFEWGGTSLGAIYRNSIGEWADVSAIAWTAGFGARATWLGADVVRMSNARRTRGASATLLARDDGGVWRAAVELESDRARYAIEGATQGEGSHDGPSGDDERMLAAVLERDTRIGSRWRVSAGGRGTLGAGGRAFLEPRLSARFTASPRAAISLATGRSYQTVQSARNGESLVRAVFGADLPVMGPRVPVARSDDISATVVITPAAYARVSVDAYHRDFSGLLLPGDETAPFAIEGFTTGTGTAWGSAALFDLSLGRVTGRLAVSAARTTVRPSVTEPPPNAGTVAYHPAFDTPRSISAGASHRFGGGTHFRAAMFGQWRRRTTMFEGPLEWGGCDAFDGGCQMSGTAERPVSERGGVVLPAYVRWDVGARHAWSAVVAGRAATLEAHATLHNVLGRSNIWAYTATTAATLRAHEHRPRSLVTVGLDFRF